MVNRRNRKILYGLRLRKYLFSSALYLLCAFQLVLIHLTFPSMNFIPAFLVSAVTGHWACLRRSRFRPLAYSRTPTVDTCLALQENKNVQYNALPFFHIDTSCANPDAGLGVRTYKVARMASDNVGQITLELDGGSGAASRVSELLNVNVIWFDFTDKMATVKPYIPCLYHPIQASDSGQLEF